VSPPIHALGDPEKPWERVMPATQSRSNGSLSANFIQQFDQAHEQAKSVFAVQKELLDTLEEINEHWFARAKSEAEFAAAMANKARSRAVHARYDHRLSGLVWPAHATMCRG
jgi:hypothetical protein